MKFRSKLWLSVLVLATTAVLTTGCKRGPASPDSAPSGIAKPPTQAESKRPHFAFVPNNIGTFWTIARNGIDKALTELPIECDFRAPAAGTVAEQQRILEDLVAKGVDGIAISPISPEKMTHLLNEVASKTILICHDSDAPQSNRRVYIGTNNFEAGRAAGRALKATIGNGPANVVVFVGTPGSSERPGSA